jgi:hypothetical protein
MALRRRKTRPGSGYLPMLSGRLAICHQSTEPIHGGWAKAQRLLGLLLPASPSGGWS